MVFCHKGDYVAIDCPKDRVFRVNIRVIRILYNIFLIKGAEIWRHEVEQDLIELPIIDKASAIPHSEVCGETSVSKNQVVLPVWLSCCYQAN